MPSTWRRQGEVAVHLRQVHQEGAQAFALLPGGLCEAVTGQQAVNKPPTDILMKLWPVSAPTYPIAEMPAETSCARC